MCNKLILKLIILMFGTWSIPVFGNDKYTWNWLENNTLYNQNDSEDVDVEFFLREEIVVRKSKITVENVAECVSSRVDCQKYKEIYLIEAPLSGKKITLTKKIVYSELQKKLKEHTFKVYGPDEIALRVVMQQITEHEIEKKLQAKINAIENISADTRVSIKYLKLMTKWVVRSEDFRIDFPEIDADYMENIMAQTKKTRSTRLRVIAYDNETNNMISENNLYLRLDLEKKIFIATERIEKEAKILDNQVKEIWATVNSQYHKYPSSLESFKNLVSKKMIPKGTLLKDVFFKKPIIIKRGQYAHLQMGRGRLELVARVVAKEPGYLGEIIDVYYKPTKKYLRAKVMGKNILQKVDDL